jgi:hypothetical protein
LATLQLFPPSLRDALVSDPVFRNSYGFVADPRISFGQSGVSVQQSELFNAIRAVLGNEGAQPALRNADGKEWRIELIIAIFKCLRPDTHNAETTPGGRVE